MSQLRLKKEGAWQTKEGRSEQEDLMGGVTIVDAPTIIMGAGEPGQ